MPPATAVLIILAALDATFIAFIFDWSTTGATNTPSLRLDEPYLAREFALSLWLVAILTMISMGLYSEDIIVRSGLFLRIGIAFILAVSVSYLILFYVASRSGICQDCSDLPVRIMAVWFGWVLVTRGALATTFELGLFKRRVIVLGAGRFAARIAEMAKNRRNRRFEPVAFIGFEGECAAIGRERLCWYDEAQEPLAEWGSRLGIEEIVVAADESCDLPVGQLLECKLVGIRITRFLDFWERETHSVNLEALQPNWLLYSDGFCNQSIALFVKRAIDIVGSLALLIFTSPLQIFTACLIKLDSAGPVLYRQERVGLRGRPFMILKFRSMYTDAERDGNPRWTAADDPRVTRVGRIIRMLRIDELPQIFNVLRGDMSLIGPRPERPFFVEQLVRAIPFYAERHQVRPGITGWAQVNYPYGASVDDARCKLSFDLYYVKNRSLLIDLQILLKTVRIIFGLEGR